MRKETPHKKKMATKMKLRHELENILDDFIKHGKDEADEAMWKYARVNRLSDQLGINLHVKKQF